ncbi:hypothetical protein [Promicromonospora sukumoe]|uniref:hypothetical protein n=1 Tax=Promicromonospora sukumoe TaxID=88382 RepID=UPI0036637A68
MTITPETLLRGSRGRRFLLEYARRSEALAAGTERPERPFSVAAMLAGYDLDPGRGRSVVLMSAGGRDVEPHDATPGSVAALLGEIPLAELDPETALRTLADTVTFARYWQEPDGEDMLAALPVVRAALERVAVHVAGSAAVGWWTEPLANGDQHAVTWNTDRAPAPMGAADRLALWSAEVRAEERSALKDRPDDPTASWSGTWWSAPPSDLTHTARSLGQHGPTGLWLVEDDMGWERAVTRRVGVPAGARVHEVDRPEAWAALCREFPLDVTAQKRHDWYRTTGRAGRWVLPDWAAVAARYDAVHLTAAAYLAAAGTAIPVGDDTASVIAGWNPDETYWFVDTVRPERNATPWAHDDEDWVPGSGVSGASTTQPGG